MFAKSLADLGVRSELVWQNKGESSLQRAINSEEGGAAWPEWGLVLGWCLLLKDAPILSQSSGPAGRDPDSLPAPLSRISLGILGSWVTCWEVGVTCTSQGRLPLGTRKCGSSLQCRHFQGGAGLALACDTWMYKVTFLSLAHGPGRYGHSSFSKDQGRTEEVGGRGHDTLLWPQSPQLDVTSFSLASP